MKNIRILIINNYDRKEYYIDTLKKIIIINGIVKEISLDKINNLANFFLSWKKEYSSSKIIDGEEFEVVVTDDKEVTRFYGKGEYPKNYNNFKEFLVEL